MSARNRPRFALESIVFLRVDAEDGGMVTGLIERPGGVLCYLVTWPDHEETSHWEAELTSERTFSGTGGTATEDE